MITINGKSYPLWSQFVERQEEWVGGALEDFGDSVDGRMFDADDVHAITPITGITLRANGKDSAFFSVEGERFSCGFDVGVGGISGQQDDKDWLEFSGYGGHRWRIKKP